MSRWVALAVVLAIGAGPLAWLVLEALGTQGAGAMRDLAFGPGRGALWNTVLVSAGAAALALGLGLPLGVLTGRTSLPARRILAGAFTLPFALPPFLLGMGWVFLASPRVGHLNRLLGEGTFNIYGRAGMAFVLGVASTPLVLLAVRSALARTDGALEEAARIAGASPLRALLDVSVPIALPSALSAAALAFLFAASAFGVPYLLGVVTQPPVPVLTTRIYAQTLLGGREHLHHAMSLSVGLLALGMLALAASRWAGRSGRAASVSGKGAAPRAVPLGRAGPLLAGLGLLAAAALVALPLGAVVLSSFQRSAGAQIALNALTLDHWAQVLGSPRALWALGRSFGFALAAAAAVALGGAVVAELSRRGGRAGRLLEHAAVWPYAVPGTVLAIALLTAYSRDLRFVLLDRVALVLALGQSGWLVAVAYVAKYLAIGTRGASEALAQIDPSLPEAARLSGATAARAFRDVTFPLIRPAVGSAFALAFLLCATELTLSVLLVAPGQDLVGTLMFEWQSYAEPAAASVLATVVVGVAAVGAAAAGVLRGR